VETSAGQRGGIGDSRSGHGRELLVDAFTKVAAERGYPRTTVEEVERQADVSPGTFHAQFPDTLQAFIAAYDVYFDRLFSQAANACKGEVDWPSKVRAVVACGLECLHETPSRARLFTVEAVGAGPALLERRFTLIARIAAQLREGRRHHPRAAVLPAAMEWVLVAGAFDRVTSHLLAEETSLLPLMEPDLSALLLAPYPYVGLAEASAIAEVS
jgi:AcrR family transcriptional regulator